MRIVVKKFRFAILNKTIIGQFTLKICPFKEKYSVYIEIEYSTFLINFFSSFKRYIYLKKLATVLSVFI